MKKAALITIFRVPNYGSVLQAFASVRLLSKLGYACDIIDYIYPNEWHYSLGKRRYRESLVKKAILFFAGKLGLKKSARQKIELKKFFTQHLPLTRSFNSLESLEKNDWTGYDVAVVGSDQVWNPNYHYGDKAFMLSFIPDNIKKTSIASSFATDSVPEQYQHRFKECLSRFSSITVRENNGKRIILDKLNLNIDTDVVLDPTLMVSSEEWLDALDIKKNAPGRKYLLVYYLSYAFKTAPYIFELAEYLSKKYDMEVRVICGDRIAKKHLKDFINETGCSPQRFVSLFANAEMVVTSSFHGTAFAVNFGKPLAAIVPQGGDDRQKSLLKNLGIENCAVYKDTPMDSVNPFYNIEKEQAKLDELRSSSIEIIKNNLA